LLAEANLSILVDHPNPKLLITLQDWRYMAMLKEKVTEIEHTMADFGLSKVGIRG
jgi:hypothetical protein